MLTGQHEDRLYLLFDVRDDGGQKVSPVQGTADGITFLTRNPRGLFSFTIEPEAPGPLQLRSDRGDSGQVEGFWLETGAGYRVELAMPALLSNTDISFQAQYEIRGQGRRRQRVAGPLADPEQPGWISLTGHWHQLSQWLSRSEIASARTWLVDSRAWVLADSNLEPGGTEPESGGVQQTTWLQRLLYRLVAGARTEIRDRGPGEPVRLSEHVVQQALGGSEASNWTQDLDTAVVWNTVAVPIVLQDGIHGAIVMQSTSDGLLLVTNRALGRLLFTTLALTIGLAAGLWYFASRLSRRVRRLSAAVSEAMEDGVDPDVLPLRGDRDELGELARNNQKLLRAVADYSQYLQTLAGKLSHELKTPLAITRSSLDNLSSQPLEAEPRRFLERAQEGVDRQAAIVRAMSEASRLEAAIAAAEWEDMDLAGLVRHCVEGYVSAYPGRRLLTRLPEQEARLRCAPDLLAQALDKLVDNAMSLSASDDAVTVSLADEGNSYHLAVRNTGSRLPDELQERLFDSLVSLREKRSPEPHLGLGLYIVRLVAEAHGGQITARNLPAGRGVEFVICLPTP
jgi:signal transduction histidine kinase